MTINIILKYILNIIILLPILWGCKLLISGIIKNLIFKKDLPAIEKKKKRIVYGVSLIIISFVIYLIVGIINPQLLLIKLPFFKKEPIDPYPPTYFSTNIKTISALEIPIGKLIDNNSLEKNNYFIKENDYPLLQINSDYLNEYKHFGNELDGKWNTLSQLLSEKENEINPDASKIKNLINEIQEMKGQLNREYWFKEAFSTRIEDVDKKKNELINSCYPRQKGKEQKQLCWLSGISELSVLNQEFKNKYDQNFKQEVESVIKELEEKTKNLKKNNEIKTSADEISKLSNIKERYDLETENLIDRIKNQARAIEIIKCIDNESRKKTEQEITGLIKTIEVFRDGYQIRRDVWKISKDSLKIIDSLSQYEIDRTEQSEKNQEIITHIGEGVLASTRIERITDLSQKIKEKSEQIQEISAIMKSVAETITTLSAGCNCALCKGMCNACKGDACGIIRIPIIGNQIVLIRGSIALSSLSLQLQEYIDELSREKTLLISSLDKSTNGLEMAEQCLKNCCKEGGTLLSLNGFLNYKSELEDHGYKIDITKNWPDIKIEKSPYTFYCLKIPKKSLDNKEKNISLFNGHKVVCKKEIKIGESINMAKETIIRNNGLLCQIKEIIKNGQKIINEASGDTSSLKKNGEEIIALFSNTPSGCSCERGNCGSISCGAKCCTPCIGNFVCNYDKMLNNLFSLLNNDLKIRTSCLCLSNSSNEIKSGLIKKNIQELQWELRDIRKNIDECFNEWKISKHPVFKQLYQCEKAKEYNWTKECSPFNFFCCFPK
ncbi:MAG: hypothetical protein U9P88_01830 [Patescibacteria group bacterium]|nr:hypothetical protein [Patescibacteria group bacterium]